MSKKKKSENKFVLMPTSSTSAMVVELADNDVSSVHPSSVRYDAAEWLLDDLNSDPTVVRHPAIDLGELYEKAAGILELIDYAKPAKANSLAIAMCELNTAAEVESLRCNTEIPF